ncbi:MaoC family dehydratase N-terminal domain-containing protein [Streptomyces sp. NBC_01537]|uniref:FAS1-like dehydratase domain-containing protein n=1 Tax=Streptomyces sp. NBC_01537 TaxID=2903896 RepID=UPI003869E5D2
MAATRFPVEAGHIMMFARAIGDEEDTTVAPPTFTMASAHYDPDSPLRPLPGQEWLGSGRGPGVAVEGSGGLHAEQHFEYHRPLRAGDTLTVSTRPGRSWDKAGRAGLLRFSEQITEYRDEAGELVVTARTVGVVTTQGEGT